MRKSALWTLLIVTASLRGHGGHANPLSLDVPKSLDEGGDGEPQDEDVSDVNEVLCSISYNVKDHEVVEFVYAHLS